MLKKASTVAAVVAGLMMVGAPAFALAGEPHDHDDWNDPGHGGAHWQDWADDDEGDHAQQFGLINFGNDSDLLSNINLCNIEVNVIAIPVLSHNDDPSLCVNTDDDDNDQHGQSTGN
ncbi:hypothetical protein ACRAKI_03665 [Saccharothrix isguenensis]